jgi:hypothetical protein
MVSRWVDRYIGKPDSSNTSFCRQLELQSLKFCKHLQYCNYVKIKITLVAIAFAIFTPSRRPLDPPVPCPSAITGSATAPAPAGMRCRAGTREAGPSDDDRYIFERIHRLNIWKNI